jgi:Zn-dependent metalloprotease
MRLHRSTALAGSAVAALLVAGGAAVAVTRSTGPASAAFVAAPAATVPAANLQAVAVPAAPPAVHPKPAAQDRDRAERRARAALTSHRKAISGSRDDRYRTRDVVLDADGAQHVRFDRTYHGLDVLGGDLVVHTGTDGAFRSATVAQSAPITVDTTPAVSAAKAVAAASAGHGASSLVVDATDGAPVLAWRITVDDGRRTVIVDARTGTVRRSYDEVETAEAGTGHGQHYADVPLSTKRRTDGRYELVDPTRGGTETRDGENNDPGFWTVDVIDSSPFVDADNRWGTGQATDRQTAAVDVQYGLTESWDYFSAAHGRRGYAGDGKGIVGDVHVGKDLNNAYFVRDCLCLYFGDGSSPRRGWTSLDVVGHEFAHAVTNATAKLNYYDESGGLNEATSDIFGTMVEFAANNPLDPPDYLLAERVDPGGAPLRYMEDPVKDGKSPSCWDGRIREPHSASGVANKFFFTLAVGSGRSGWGDDPTCNGAPAVTGIGNDAAARIWYRALTVYMVSTTDYAAARTATLRAAADLYGVTGAERAAVGAAWTAVGVVDPAAEPMPPVAPVITPMIGYTGEVGVPVSIQLTATDPQGDPVTFSSANLPDGVSIDASGLITGAFTRERWSRGVIIATDTAGNRGFNFMIFSVSGSPVVTSPGHRSGTVGATFDVPVTATDEAPWEWTVTATGLPDGVTVPVKPGVRSIVGVPTHAGSGTATVTVTDSTKRAAFYSFTWTIAEAALPAAPTAVTGSGSGPDMATVTWAAPALGADGVPITGFTISGLPGGTRTADGKDRSAILTGLAPGVTYTVQVRAVNLVGTSAPGAMTLTGTTSVLAAPAAIVDTGKPVTFTGTLRTAGGTGLAGAVLTIEERRPATGWTAVGSVTTGKGGAWSRSLKPTVNSTYRATYAGGPVLLGSASTSRPVAVRYTVTAKASNAKPKAKKKIAITGVVKPSRAKSTVVLQRLVGKKWVKVASAKTTSKGAYTFSRSFTKGTWKLRVLASADKYNAEKASTTFTVTAK